MNNIITEISIGIRNIFISLNRISISLYDWLEIEINNNNFISINQINMAIKNKLKQK